MVLEAGGSVLVSDNGRGIPVDKEPKTKLSGVELVMTKLHAGGKFGGGSYTASGGLHGVGASVVNALSSRLDVEVDRSGKTHGMSFRRGVPGVFDGAGPDGEFQRAKGLNVVGKATRSENRHSGAMVGRSAGVHQGCRLRQVTSGSGRCKAVSSFLDCRSRCATNGTRVISGKRRSSTRAA